MARPIHRSAWNRYSRKFPVASDPPSSAPGTRERHGSTTSEPKRGDQLDYAQDAARRSQGLPPIKDYDELSVNEVTEHLDELSVEEIGEVKAYERRNKNRESLIKRMEQKINASSS